MTMTTEEQRQWNVDGAQLGRECTDHSAVRGTTYLEVHELIGTSGCSHNEPYWNWDRMGVIETKRGRLVVIPGDYIVVFDGEFYPRSSHDTK